MGFKRFLAIFLIVGLAYLPSARFSFVAYDDVEYVIRNPHMRQGLTVENVVWALTSRGYANNWHPLAWMSHMLDVSVDRIFRGGRVADDEEWNRYESRLATIMHVHNVLLHAAVAVLLVLLMCRLTKGRLNAVWLMILVLLWALHPLRVEVVCWVSERKELTSVFFMLLTLIAWVKGSRLLALVLFALALMAKPVAVSLPAVLLALDWAAEGKVRWKRLLPFAALSFVTCVLTMQSQVGARTEALVASRIMRLTSIVGAPVVYLKQTFAPIGLSTIYPETLTLNWLLLVPGVLLLGLIAFGVLRWMKTRTPLSGIFFFGVSWVYVGLLPMLGIVKVGPQEHADRYTYWVGAGAVVTIALLLVYFKPKTAVVLERLGIDPVRDPWHKLRKDLLVFLTVCAGVLCCLTVDRASYWRDSETLIRDSLTKGWHTQAVAALVEILRGRGPAGLADAEKLLRESVERAPGEWSNLELAKFLADRNEANGGADFSYSTQFEIGALVEEVLRRNPGNAEAKELMTRISKMRNVNQP